MTKAKRAFSLPLVGEPSEWTKRFWDDIDEERASATSIYALLPKQRTKIHQSEQPEPKDRDALAEPHIDQSA